ncbi:hypothetical protein [Listeria costaricensis]|uniref:hypothetical protein n=1 Tax=Listeria costaricensis TaxID=2026604 RepID=UPI000C069D84|nr:hypothetical protein [Listeria costaricensis]
MGSWGIKALESDVGLDLIDWIEDVLDENDTLFDAERIVQRLNEGEEEDLFGFEIEDFLYDNNLIGLVELIIQKAAGEEITVSDPIDQLDGYLLRADFRGKLENRLLEIDETHEWLELFEGANREKAKAYLTELAEKLAKVPVSPALT